MSVFRAEKNKGYTVMSNHHLRNHTITIDNKTITLATDTKAIRVFISSRHWMSGHLMGSGFRSWHTS